MIYTMICCHGLERNLMFRLSLLVSVLLPVVVAPAVFAQGPAPAGYHEAMIKAGGQIDALGIVCGTVGEAQAKAHKAQLRQSFAAKGVSPATFEKLYDGAFNEMKASAKANPAQARQGCDRLKKGVRPGH